MRKRVEGVKELSYEKYGGRLGYMALQRGQELRDFLLENLNSHDNVSDAARDLGVTTHRLRIDMGRVCILEVRRYSEHSVRRGGYITVATILECYLVCCVTAGHGDLR